MVTAPRRTTSTGGSMSTFARIRCAILRAEARALHILWGKP